MPKTVEFKPLDEAIKAPASCSPEGMLMLPDLKVFGRSEQLHVAIFAVHTFREEFSRNPNNNDEDMEKIVGSAKAICDDL